MGQHVSKCLPVTHSKSKKEPLITHDTTLNTFEQRPIQKQLNPGFKRLQQINIYDKKLINGYLRQQQKALFAKKQKESAYFDLYYISTVILIFASRDPKPMKRKLLILGAGECGKSTLLRNLRYLYGRYFSESELIATKQHLTQNVIEAMRTLAIYSEILYDQGHDCKVDEQNQKIKTRVARMSDKQKFTKQHCDDLLALWKDKHIKNTLYFKHKFQLNDTMPYLFDRMNNYWKDNYIPTFQDLIHCRQRTTGINKIKFEVDDSIFYEREIFEIFDAGGAKTERKKWIHFFDNATAILFVTALSGYNETLWEDSTNNKMKEAIGLFRGIVNLNIFEGLPIIICFNKYDLFCKKVGKYSVKKYFKDYNGSDNDPDEIINFFKRKFRAQRKKKPNVAQMHFHVTCAVDTMCVSRLFKLVRNIIDKVV